MKNKSRFIRKIVLQYFLSLFMVGLLAIIAFWLLSLVFSRILWYEGDPLYELLKFGKDYRYFLFGGLLVFVWIGITFYFIWLLLNYLDETIQATNQLVVEPERSIHLSKDLQAIENEMNQIRQKSLFDQRAAKEAEQRKNDLIVYLAHDLRTPLTSVIGYLTLLREEPQLSSELRAKYTNIALDKAGRLNQLIGEFFEITRFNLTNMALEKETLNLSRMLEQLCYEFIPVMQERKLQWQLMIDPDIECLLDSEKMERAFDNLIRNAIHYSYPQTNIVLSVQKLKKQIQIKVTNKGKMLPSEKLTRIFEPFYRADSARQSSTGGTGLGLPITKEIIELHGGQIFVESQGDLICFTILLPLT